MEDQVPKGLEGQAVAACNPIFPAVVHPWGPCQPLFSLGIDHFQAKRQPFYNHVTVQMIVVAVTRKISKEARTREIQVVLGIQNRCLLLRDSPVGLALVKGTDRGEASLGK